MNDKRIIIIDLDDTIATKTTRHQYDWSKVDEDDSILPVIRILDAYEESYPYVKRVILTARNEGYPNPLKKQPELTNHKTVGRELTEKWLDEHFGEYFRLIMKPAESFEKSSTFKADRIQELLDEGFEIDFLMDDNTDVIVLVKERFPFIPIIQIANY